MKTLDEVIKAKELCELNCLDEEHCQDCPYAKQDANGDWSFFCHDCEADALHYLKEYKNKQNVGTMMFALHNTNKTVCDGCWLSREMAGEGFKQIYEKYIEEENPSLTWDELKQMEGKPVWVEVDGKWWGRFWAFVEIANDTYVNFYQKGQEYPEDLWKWDIGKTWQAYRKERYDDVG